MIDKIMHHLSAQHDAIIFENKKKLKNIKTYLKICKNMNKNIKIYKNILKICKNA